MANYLIDTDWAISYLRGKPAFIKAIDELRKEGIAISTITIAELYEGVYRNPNPEKKEMALLDFLEGLQTLSVTRPVAKLFGQKRAELHRAGFTVGDMDLLIACVAERHNLTVLTNNCKHFQMVPGNLEIISI